MMLGHTNILTEVGHHAPGFYSSMFLDSSLEEMGIHNMEDMMARFPVYWHQQVRWGRASTLLWRLRIYIAIVGM